MKTFIKTFTFPGSKAGGYNNIDKKYQQIQIELRNSKMSNMSTACQLMAEKVKTSGLSTQTWTCHKKV